jgi:glycosyltransferase involved in cell wall biosynthesis
MSDHEGFCIPPIEAAAMGVPVVIKGAGAIPESMRDGAFLLPDDAGPILAAEALHEVLTNPGLRQALIARGQMRVRELQSQSHVQETVRLISEVLA